MQHPQSDFDGDQYIYSSWRVCTCTCTCTMYVQLSYSVTICQWLHDAGCWIYAWVSCVFWHQLWNMWMYCSYRKCSQSHAMWGLPPVNYTSGTNMFMYDDIINVHACKNCTCTHTYVRTSTYVLYLKMYAHEFGCSIWACVHPYHTCIHIGRGKQMTSFSVHTIMVFVLNWEIVGGIL